MCMHRLLTLRPAEQYVSSWHVWSCVVHSMHTHVLYSWPFVNYNYMRACVGEEGLTGHVIRKAGGRDSLRGHCVQCFAENESGR